MSRILSHFCVYILLQICPTDVIIMFGGGVVTTGQRIRARRKELGISADKLAESINVSRSTVFRWENGFIEKLPIDKLVPIARSLHTTVGYLMGWDDNKGEPVSGAKDGFELEASRYFDSLSEDRKLEALNYLRYLATNADKK